MTTVEDLFKVVSQALEDLVSSYYAETHIIFVFLGSVALLAGTALVGEFLWRTEGKGDKRQYTGFEVALAVVVIITFFCILVLILVPAILACTLAYILYLSLTVDSRRKKREQKAAEQKARQQALDSENSRQQRIKDDYEHAKEWLRSMLERIDMPNHFRFASIPRMAIEREVLHELEEEYLSSIREKNKHLLNNHFQQRALALLLRTAEESGVAVCYKCKTFWPSRCKRGHCLSCQSNVSIGGQCLSCAEMAGHNVCRECKRVDPPACDRGHCQRCHECRQCGSCGECTGCTSSYCIYDS